MTGGGARSSGSSTRTSIFDPGQRQHPLDRVRTAHHGEVVPVAARELMLPEELLQPEHVHEGEAAQVQHDVTHAIGLWVQAIEHLCDLRNSEKVELAAERDQGGATVRSSFDSELLCDELLGDRSGGFSEALGPSLAPPQDAARGGRRSGEPESVPPILATATHHRREAPRTARFPVRAEGPRTNRSTCSRGWRSHDGGDRLDIVAPSELNRSGGWRAVHSRKGSRSSSPGA